MSSAATFPDAPIVAATDAADAADAAAALPEPYRSLRVLPPLAHGWQSNAAAMRRFMSRHFAGVDDVCVVEVGAWLGMSIRDWVTMVGARGRVFAVDHWEGSVEHQPGQFAHHAVLPRLYPQFLSNMIHWRVAARVTPLRLSSVHAARALGGVRPDVVYLDGAHDCANVSADMRAWYPKLSTARGGGGGVLCGDDWTWLHDRCGVQRAVNAFAAEHALDVHVDGNFWWVTKQTTPTA
jgi:hypothetical protein